MNEIGFALLTHRDPGQIRRLVTRLDHMFPHARIVCHHAFDQCPLRKDMFPELEFVHAPVRTRWGDFTINDALLLTLRQLVEGPRAPDWVIVLSGADYPIKSTEQIRHDLARGGFDSYIETVRIDPENLRNAWERSAYLRWYGRRLRVPSFSRRLRFRWKTVDIFSSVFPQGNYPFSSSFSLYTGELWFTARREVIEYVLDFHSTQPRLARHLQNRTAPDEAYVQTIVGNASGFRNANDSKRFIRWEGQNNSPNTLTLDDLPSLLATDAHFARKFDPATDSAVLDRLDKLIGYEPTTPPG